MTAAVEYRAFLEEKAHSSSMHGFAPTALPDFLFDFQGALVEWALRKGRAALFADCGLGKTPMYLAWADAVVRRENKPVLVLTPLAVGQQAIREAEKFGIEAVRLADGSRPTTSAVVITNYERLHHFDASCFAGVVCDESSILKSFDGARRAAITEFMRKRPYQHCAHVTTFPSHSFEEYYQSVRRCWRFGQTRPVRVDTVTTEGQQGVLANRQRKAAAASQMFDALVQHMHRALTIDRGWRDVAPVEVPTWL